MAATRAARPRRREALIATTVGFAAMVRASFLRNAATILRLSLAATIAAAACAVVWSQIPRELDVRTDVVGHPVHGNFNINRYFLLYELVLGWQLLTLLIFLVSRRLGAGKSRRAGAVPDAIGQQSETSPGRAARLARVGFVGLVLGVEAEVVRGRGSGLGIVIAVALFYAAVVAAVSAALVRSGRDWSLWQLMAGVNALATPLVVGGLYAVSNSTEIVVTSDNAVYRYPWFPAWLAAAICAALVITIISLAVRAMSAERLATIERAVVLLVVGPVALVLSVASLPGPLSTIDPYHQGMSLAGAHLTAEGAFPWREIIFPHGPFADVGFASVGFHLLENSWWGLIAGETLLLVPLAWLGLYFLCAYLFWSNTLFLFTTQLAIVVGVVTDIQLRWLLLPLSFLLLAALLRRSTVVRGIALTLFLFLQAVLSAETAPALVACLAVVALFELYYRDRRSSLARNFRRTLICAVSGTVFLVAWSGLLISQGAFAGFAALYRWIAPQHFLLAGVPLSWSDAPPITDIVAPLFAALAVLWLLVAKMLRREPLLVTDWVMAAAATVVLLYYPKALTRLDHLEQVTGVALPVFFYVAYRLFSYAEHAISQLTSAPGWRLGRHTLTLPSLIVLLAIAPLSVADVARAVPRKLSIDVPHVQSIPSLGLSIPGAIDEAMISDLRQVTDRFLEPGDAVFDFSNNPGLFHYVLDRPSPTRWYTISIAFHKDAQAEVVTELARRRPKLVVFTAGHGNPSWDGIPNAVRHFDVSRFVLRNYRPALYSHGFLFFARNDVEFTLRPSAGEFHEPPITNDLYFRTFQCDWGFTPNFLSTSPEDDSELKPHAVPVRRLESYVTVTGWAVDLGAQRPAVEVIAVRGNRIVARVRPMLERPDVVRELKGVQLLRSGFRLKIPLPALERRGDGVAQQDLHLYALAKTGEAWELQYLEHLGWAPQAPIPPALVSDHGTRIPVVSGATTGYLDSAAGVGHAFTLDIPAPMRSRADWLEITIRGQMKKNSFVLTDRIPYEPSTWATYPPLERPQPVNEPDRGIAFKTLPERTRTVRVLVGACSQWYGYQGNRLYVQTRVPQPVERVRLLLRSSA